MVALGDGDVAPGVEVLGDPGRGLVVEVGQRRLVAAGVVGRLGGDG